MTAFIIIAVIIGLILLYWYARRRMRQAVDSAPEQVKRRDCFKTIHENTIAQAVVSAAAAKIDSRPPDEVPPAESPTIELPPLPDDLWDRGRKLPPDDNQRGGVQIRVIIALVLFSGSLFALLARPYREGVIQSTAHASEVGDKERNRSTLNNVGEKSAADRSPTSFDAKLAELRARPSLATVSAIDRSPPIPERRAEVLAALKPLLENESKSIRLVAGNAVKRWE